GRPSLEHGDHAGWDEALRGVRSFGHGRHRRHGADAQDRRGAGGQASLGRGDPLTAAARALRGVPPMRLAARKEAAMRNSWPWRAVTSVAIAAASTAWAQAPGGAGSPSTEGTHEPTPKMQGNDAQSANPGEAGNAGANGAPVARDSESNGASNGGANSGPSPRDQPTPGLRLADRMKRLPTQRGGDGSNGAQGNGGQDNGAQGSGAENGNGNGANGLASPDTVPQNPANLPTQIFPANPHPPADPGQPGNPVTPTNLPATPTNLRFA